MVLVWQPRSVMGPLFARKDLVKNFRCLYPVEPVHLEAFIIFITDYGFSGSPWSECFRHDSLPEFESDHNSLIVFVLLFSVYSYCLTVCGWC